MSRRDETLVICYHAVSADWPSPLAVTPAQLKKVISDLLEEGFEGVTFTDAVTEPDCGKRLAVTFDDAYRSVVELAHPILARLGIPGTVFAPTAHIGLDTPRGWDGTAHWLDTEWAAELRHASWEQLAGLAAEGWEIGSHSRTHPHLRSLDDSRLAEELGESRRDCERELGTECLSLAYPYGEADARVRAATAAAGYRAAALLSYRLPVRGRQDRLRWPRLSFQVDDSHIGFKTWLYRHSPRAWNAVQVARESLRRLAGGLRRK